MKGLVTAFARNIVFANILMLLILFGGFLGATNMLREIFPEFSVDVITVAVAYPGFDPEEVEEGISRKLEEAVEGLEGIKRYSSTSVENQAALMIEVFEGYDLKAVKDRIETAINGVPNLPVDAEKPIVDEITIRGEVVVLSILGPPTERGRKEWAEDLKDEILELPGITQVDVQGTRAYEIAVEVSEDRLREYGMTLDDVAAAVQRNNVNLPAGNLRTKGEEVRLRTVGRKYTGKEFSDIVLMAGMDGEFVTLDQVADISDGFAEDEVISNLNGESALNILVFKTQEEDMVAIAKTMNDWVAKKNPTLPEGYNILMWSDNSIDLQKRIRLLLRNGAIGLTLVFFLLWLFLDFRLSFWAAMGIPISLGGGLAIMWFYGATLNMISLFALIMVLGIIVDDAIVVGEAIYVHRKRGDGPLHAAVNGTMEVGLPVIAAVTTSIIAFMPLMFVDGVMGKFIAIMPVAVISALLISLIECLVLLPAHLNHLPDPNVPQFTRFPTIRKIHLTRMKFSHGLEWFIDHVYGPFLKICIKYRYVVACVAVSVVMATYGLLSSGALKFLLFPALDGNDIVSTVEFPSGTPIETTQKAIAQMEAALLRLRDRELAETGRDIIINRYTSAGDSLNSGGGGPGMGGPGGSGSHVGSIRVKLMESVERDYPAEEFMVDWEKEVGLIPGAMSLLFTGLSQGPPGSAVEIWVKGEKLNDIIAASEELKQELRTYEGTYQVRSDHLPGKNEMRLKLKPEARSLGLTVQDLGRQARSGYYGNEVLRLQRGRDDIRVKIRYTAEERARVSDFENIRIRTPQGAEVPLMSVADVEYGPGFSTIQRTDGVRRVQVSADVDTNRGNTNEIIAAMRDESGDQPSYFDELGQKYPGVEFSFQGAINDSRESLDSLRIGFRMALLGIFVVIATIFRSYLQPFIIMMIVPFGIIGAIWGHFLFGYDIEMMSIFGMVALSGVVVNDAIVLIESLNGIVALGTPFFEALVKAGRRRFRAIFLTTISTCGGLAPIIMAKDPQAMFLIPMALSIAAGVAFATLLTLILIPCMLGMLNDFRRISRLVVTGKWPTADDVEPARLRNVDPLRQPALEPQIVK
jgi:multidrug efflux pump subunit AcrB